MPRPKLKQFPVLMLLGQDFLVPKIDPRVYKEAKTLISEGFIVTLIYLTTKPSKINEFEQIRLLSCKDRLYLPGFKNKNILLAIPRIIWGLMRNLVCIIRTTNNLHFKIVHCHDADTLLAGLVIKLLKFGRIKLIYDSHEIATEMASYQPFRPLIKFTEKIASFWVDGFITINMKALAFLLKRYPRFAKMPLVLKNVPSNYYPLKQLTVHHPLRFIYQGSLKKGRIEIVEAIVKELNHYDDKLWQMAILGNIKEVKPGSVLLGNPQVTIRKMIFDKTRFFKELSEFDLGIVAMDRSCLNNYYSLPNKLFDYMLSGVAVLAPAYPVISKIIHETGAGYLLDGFSSEQSIERVIKQIIENPKRILPKKKNGLIWVRKKYNWNFEKTKLLDFYRKLSQLK